jgi:L-amino acid N-acyltransferase YncA
MHEAAGGREIGAALLRASVDLEAALGYLTPIVRIAQDNTAALRLHDSPGLQPVGVVREAGQEFGRCFDVHVMEIIYADPVGHA